MTDSVNTTNDEAAQLWVESYQGEVLGEAYFAGMAERNTDPALREKIDLLRCLERSTKELLEPVIARLGIPAEPDKAVLDAAGSVTEVEYLPMLQSFVGAAAEYLGRYTRLRTLVEGSDAPIVDQLIAHELAFELFARRELAGETDTSTEPIRALSHVTC
ncbi:hypothetical protein A5745_10865 [Mycobacterium sp. IS-2888]|uniref:hypothetical protein n=1 Tax=unclassified Mycobacterium TaxID=2642494 RepID=UPI00096EE4F8|nr:MULTISPECIES: hypothetical protein [unclassified Mycobacterium]OMC42979.1 hypothetical protein A5744_15045 [Mycobacterium sp. IS-1264]OMC46889.1 hypothetical protein A5745_10865 [Mycobacterium sp. IS-2888]